MRKRNRHNRLAGPTTARPAGTAPAPAGATEMTNPSFVAPNAPATLNVTAFEGELASDGEALQSNTVLIPNVAMFRAGDYGPKGMYTEEDLQEMVNSYDPDWLEAPVTVDHVQTGPALGWIEKVYADGDTLYGDFLVSRATYEAMRAGAYKRRSIEIYRGVPYKDGSKVQYVKACSILGAATPEVKGLPQVSFHEGFAPYDCIEFTEDTIAPEAGDETTEKEATMPSGVKNNAPVATNASEPTADPAPGGVAAFSSNSQAEFDAKVQSAVNAALSGVKEDYEKKLKEAEERNARFAEGLAAVNERLRQADESQRFNTAASAAAAEGRLSRIERDILAHVFNALPYDAPDGSNAVPFTVGEGEGAESETLTPRQILLRYMETKAVVAPVGDTLMTAAQPAFTSAPLASGSKRMEPAERARWIDKRATELHNADPSKDYGECMLMAERELAGK